MTDSLEPGDRVFIVVDESSGQRFVFTDNDEAREANSVGHWSRRALYPATFEPDEELWGDTDD